MKLYNFNMGSLLLYIFVLDIKSSYTRCHHIWFNVRIKILPIITISVWKDIAVESQVGSITAMFM